MPDTNTQVNGAFCFGVAIGASDTLVCALASTGEVQCADQLAGDGYIVRWTSSLGSVFGLSGNGPLGTIAQLQSDKFEISTATAGRPLGVCTLPNTDITRAVFCAYAQ